MSRIDELSEQVYDLEFTKGKTTKQVVREILLQYGSELRRAIGDKIDAQIDGDSPQHDGAVTRCGQIVYEVTI